MTSDSVGVKVVFHRLVMSNLVARSMCVITSLKGGGSKSVVKFSMASCGVSVMGR